MKINIYLRIFMAMLLLPGAARAELLSISQDKLREVITLSLPAASPSKIFTLPSPERLVVNVPAMKKPDKLSLPGDYKGGLLVSVRFGQFDAKTSRFVFELSQKISVVDQSVQNNRIVLTIAPAGAKPTSGSKLKQKEVDKPLVVIDPGHGGDDPGTIGTRGTQEKNVVLAFAKALKRKIDADGKYRAMLTRSDDRFIMLRQRVAIARKAGASLFISLHADSAPNGEARGLSVYTVSETASDAEAEALAARENKSDVIAGMDLSSEREDVADILISLAQRETKNRSATFADMLVTKLEERVSLLPNTHRFAGFAVLKAPDIPSVLIETGFLSHPKEEKLLSSQRYRDQVVEGIAEGIDAYFSYKKKSEGE